MRVRLRGVRGSIAVPGADTVKYGGNTTCVEIRSDAGDVVIIDAGTGIRPLGLELMKDAPVTCTLFITHTHWDHIQGLPFFVPLFVPGNRIDIYGSFDPVYKQDLKQILTQQMQYCYFPVWENELKAEISYQNLREYEQVKVGGLTITSILMNHPVLNFGYLVEGEGKRFFFSGDHEPAQNIYEPGDSEYDDYQALIAEQENVITEFIRDVDCAVIDSQYTMEEYTVKSGWGHGTYYGGIGMAEKAGVRHLYLTHHDPERKDQELDEIYGDLLDFKARNGIQADIHLARENIDLEL